MKSLKDISWNVPESEYRQDPALSYSTLAKFERGGFNSLSHLFDKVESPSLTFGSAVDSIITGGMTEFNERFKVCDFSITDGGASVCRLLSTKYKDVYKAFKDIPEDIVSAIAQEAGFWKDPKWNKKRYSEVLKTGNVELFYESLANSDLTIIDRKTYDDVLNAVRVLKSSDATRFYFANDNPFDGVERYYQLKFKANLNGIDYRIMADLIMVNHKEKTIQMIDLKTSSHNEWEFYKSFVDWGYNWQARLYSRVFKVNMIKDEYFKDFTMLPYLFIVVNRNSLTPLVWRFEDTFVEGTLTYGKKSPVEMRDPEDIGKDLHQYLTTAYAVPIGIKTDSPNSITQYLNSL